MEQRGGGRAPYPLQRGDSDLLESLSLGESLSLDGCEAFAEVEILALILGFWDSFVLTRCTRPPLKLLASQKFVRGRGAFRGWGGLVFRIGV